MSNTKWTQGEWVVMYSSDGAIVVCGNNANPLTGYGVIYMNESTHDAHLIAAAPDLYEALEQAVTSMQDNGYPNKHLAVRAARHALKKARGEL